MIKSIFTTAAALGLCLVAEAGVVEVTSMRYAGPFPVKVPFMLDSIDVNSKKFDAEAMISTPVSLSLAENGADFTDMTLPAGNETAIHLLNFTIDNERYAECALKIDWNGKHEAYLDGRKMAGTEMALTPATHSITIKCLTTGQEQTDSIRVALECDHPELLKTSCADGRRYTLRDVMNGRRLSSAKLSPSGKYLLTVYHHVHDGGQTTTSREVKELSTGKLKISPDNAIGWMPMTDRLYFTRRGDGKTQFVVENPEDGSQTVMSEDIPDTNFVISPTENFLIYTKEQKGPKEKSEDLYEILNPEDRQPGWRDRGSLMKFDLATGMSSQLTFGFRNIGFAGLSDDGRKMLFTATEPRFSKRPTTLSSLYIMDLATYECRLLVDKDGFMGAAKLSPDGKYAALSGSPEAFGGIGRNLPDDKTPSMTDNQLYILDVESGDIRPLTKDFNPSVEYFSWNRADGDIYFTAENRDCLSLYRVNPKSGRIDNLGAREDNVSSFSTASSSPLLVYFGQGASNSDRLYSLNTRNLRHNIIEDISAERLAGIKLGKCEAWDFMTSRGDTICARYILPPDFNPSRKYPMIVNYYGGCSPTTRALESRYPHHVYAANGYVVLVIIPSGSTGFGQEFSSRHVNTAGEGVAEDIIEGVKQFCCTHPWVNSSKIGCIGASYGGFMTQYLQTKTDIFAAAISHAGISDHTSYWGEGYWGYSYSEVSMANSYPWTHPDLYVKQSPLYNADKIHTPILFLHGDADTNVPVGESIQMYTALKLLGRETAFVAVKDANHQILDYKKREQWQNTIFAWFAKYLQDDPSWWDALYPAKAMR